MKRNQSIQNRKQVNLLITTGTNNALKCSKDNSEKKKKTETLSHRITKFWLANFCWENGIDFATECVFKDNKRCDFVVKDWAISIEVLGTESIQRFINKSYPLPTIPISATMKPELINDMMNDLMDTQGHGWDFYLKRNIEDIQNKIPRTVKRISQVMAKGGMDE